MNHLLHRRAFLQRSLTGLSSIALASLLKDDGLLASEPPVRPTIDPARPYAPRVPHFTPRANRVLMIFCSGALSHVDTWDYKPELFKRHDTPMPGASGLITFQGENGNLIKPIRDFRPRGQSGKMLSDLLPNLAELADDMCFIHSMTAKSNTHGPAENQMGTGYILDGFPSCGAWVTYALGTENQNLPAYVAIPDPRGVPQIGPRHWGSAFLPAAFQGTAFNAQKSIPNLARPASISENADRETRDFLRRLNDQHLKQNPGDSDLAARISAYELAARMQLAAAQVSDLSTESKAMQALYGVNDPNVNKAGFARNCIMARRLIESGVRFVQLFNGSYAMGEGVGNWDGHRKIHEQYAVHAPILDQPCAALIKDLKARGLLSDTLIAFVTEFGRMPTFQKGANGRDHNPKGFSVWLAGAGVKPAFSYGATDEFGYQAVENVTSIYDLHATMLHLLGLNHERLSFYNNGIERRLTDVHGRVITDILVSSDR
ncbi:DUF1501 domain-containing protein [Humisphaera borealis]|uniref:DUF1501 domain-containing protein n=1 Tax=Humisphaera borealis TaxID=2807512 RepID=A0A7M2WW15_9BACT|nr:DUF1501 domain-containing protein [Humisphaera borealis]QOV89569.1 DUF1501 domain-containing protein [Humisphaera borealis]